jgi:hypothetical protein
MHDSRALHGRHAHIPSIRGGEKLLQNLGGEQGMVRSGDKHGPLAGAAPEHGLNALGYSCLAWDPDQSLWAPSIHERAIDELFGLLP